MQMDVNACRGEINTRCLLPFQFLSCLFFMQGLSMPSFTFQGQKTHTHIWCIKTHADENTHIHKVMDPFLFQCWLPSLEALNKLPFHTSATYVNCVTCNDVKYTSARQIPLMLQEEARGSLSQPGLHIEIQKNYIETLSQ